MVQTFVSQAPQDWRPEYAALPTSVNASARVEASTILDEMLEHARIEDGAVVVPDWALHKAALRIETVRKKGYPCEIDPDG